MIFILQIVSCSDHEIKASSLENSEMSWRVDSHGNVHLFSLKLSGIVFVPPTVQVEAILPLLKRGVGIHHGGLLPILKEVIEILFQVRG